MHTFFINSSKNMTDAYSLFAATETENRRLIPIKCLFSEWNCENKGYKNCVKQITDMIDAYYELDSAFNIIIYIDLSANERYASAGRDLFRSREREACLSALKILYSHIVSHTLVKEFENTALKPSEVLIIFGEDIKPTVTNVIENLPSKEDIYEEIAYFTGIPDIDDIEKEVKLCEDKDKEVLIEKINGMWKDALYPGIRDFYEKEFSFFFGKIHREGNVSEGLKELCNRIASEKAEVICDVLSVSCRYDFLTADTKGTETHTELNILLHLLKCVKAASVIDFTDAENPKAIPFVSYTTEEIAALLKRKKAIFKEKISEIENMSDSYSDYNLTPSLYTFDHAKFSLDEFGETSTEIYLEENNDNLNIDGKTEKLEVRSTPFSSLFSKDSYTSFDYSKDTETETPTKKTTPWEHIEYGKKVKKMHMDFLKRFELHLSERLSNYAGKSKENKPALLKSGGFHYTDKTKKEKKAIETVEKISDTSYETVLKRYMNFCAGRSVSVTDISHYCDLYISRINQITVSLSRLKLTALLSFAALLLLYFPFFTVKYAYIAENNLTCISFLLSFLIPAGLLCFSFAKAASEQKKKYLKERYKLKEKSDAIIAKNAEVAHKYDILLSSVIPSLRWIYEYKLDVKYYKECCDTAAKKLMHHKSKLSERINAIENILSDIEDCTGNSVSGYNNKSYKIDYTLPFCAGEDNCKLYSITDDEFLNSHKN